MNKKELYKEVEDLDLFNIGIRKYVALSEVMYLIKQLDEPQKVEIPKFVADWIEYCKDKGYTLTYALYHSKESNNEEVYEWVNESLNNQETFALAWINGYDIDKEKKYLVKIKGDIQENILVYGYGVHRYFFSSYMYGNRQTYHTKADLISGGFGWVFSCEGVEVEEVEE